MIPLFLDELQRISRIIKPLVKEKTPKIYTHIDGDGITSAAILIKSLVREGTNFEIHALKQLSSQTAKEIKCTRDNLLIFLDMGSGQLNTLKEFLETTQILILDHHEPLRFQHINLFHLNPLLFNEKSISSSSVCYLFCRSLNQKNSDSVDLALVGSLADRDQGTEEISKKILEEAEILGKVVKTKGLRLFGRNTRPLHRALSYSFDPHIPGISGDESQAVQLLSEIGISVKENDEWKKLKDLTEEEQKKLASAIIKESYREKDISNIFGDIYTLTGKPEEIQDANEFSTLLNACGRTGNFDLGVQICLDDESALAKSWAAIENYKKVISDSLNMIREGKVEVISNNSAVYILGKDLIPENIIGAITSMALNSNLFPNDKVIFGMVDSQEGLVKISARAPEGKDVNLGKVMKEIFSKIPGEGGGHMKAAGGFISKESLQDFIKTSTDMLGEKIGKEN